MAGYSQLSLKLTKQIDKWPKLAVSAVAFMPERTASAWYVDFTIEKFAIIHGRKQCRISVPRNAKWRSIRRPGPSHYSALNADARNSDGIKTRTNNIDR